MSAKKETAQSPIAIVGIGCLFPKAENARRFWANIKGGVDAIGDVPASHWLPEEHFDKNPKRPDMTYARRGGFILPVDFDPSEFGLAPNALEATDSAQLLGLLTAKMALEDAGYGPGRDFDRGRVSVILGVTGALELVIPLGARLGHPKWRKALSEFGISGADAEAIISRMQEDYVPWQESSFPGLLGNVVSGRIANRFNLGGTNCVVDAACGSSLGAVHMATLELAAGRSSMVVTGGVDCFNDIFMYMCFSKTPALSPSGDAKSFDASADGTALGEGLGMMVMKRLEDAVKDGDRIYAVIKGVGSSSDGKGKAIYAPSSEGQARALRNAYAAAGVEPGTVELAEAHGTGTTVGDGVELDALTEVYRENRAEGAWCALGSVKSMIGHTKAAAGSAGMIKAALALYNKTLPPTIKVTTPLKKLAEGTTPFYLNTELRPWIKKEHPRRAGVSALGFGGSNFHAVLEEHSPEKPQPDWDGDAQLAVLSGKDAGEIRQALAPWKALNWDGLRLAAMRARAAFQPGAPARLGFVLEHGQDWKKVLESALANLDSQKAASWATPDGVYFSSAAPEKLAVLFPGQGAQYPGMQRDLACRFPETLAVLTEADKAFGGVKALSDYLYPRAAFTPEAKQRQADDLKDTSVAQPALGAAELGAWRALAAFGLKPAAFAGHSYGELTALCAAGAYGDADLFSLSKLRGALMAAGSGDRGGMLAVQAPLAEVEKAVKEEKLDLIIANKNTPSQFVLSGATPEIKRAAERLTARGLKNTPLQVSAAFHSPLVAGAQKEFSAALGKVKFAKPQTTVYANKTAAAYPDSADKARDLLASQLASPVEFTAMIEKMHADGIRIFLEVGPGARLTGMASAILAGKEHTAFALDASAGKKNGVADLARALARLAALGCGLDLAGWEGGADGAKDADRKISKLAVKLTGANYRSPRPAAPAPKRQLTLAPAAQQAQYAPAAPAPQGYASEALRITQESMAALQKLQEQTALLHARFLEGQEAAQRSFQALVDQQQQLFTGAPAAAPVFQAPAFAAPAPRPAAAPQPAPAPALQPAGAGVEKVLLAIVSSQTGYPAESLNPDMDMESDLGIDSIKRVAILSELQEKLPGAPRITPEQLGSIRTLRQVSAYLSAGMPAVAAAPVQQTAGDGVEKVLLSIVSSQTGYPAESLNPDMDMESDLGIDSIKRVAILSELQEKLPGAPRITPEQLGSIRTLRQVTAYLSAGMPATPALAPAPAAGQDVSKVLLSIVSAQTGYPAESLNPDMDMESDLGIDSIKRVAILSELQEKLPSAPRITPEQLGSIRTLRQVTAYLSAGMPATAAPAAAAVGQDVSEVLLAIVSVQTGYPAESLNPDMDMESDLGIDSIKRVAILSELQEKLPGAPRITPEQLGSIRTLRQVTAYLNAGASPAPATPAPASAPAARAVETEIVREVLKTAELDPAAARKHVALDKKFPIWVTDDGSALAAAVVKNLEERGYKARKVSLDGSAPAADGLAALVLLAPAAKLGKKDYWSASSELFLKQAFRLVRAAGPALKAAGKISGASLMTVSRLDGAFGMSGLKSEQDPVFGGLAGLAKTAGHEWPEVSCRAVDAAADWSHTVSVAQALTDELFFSGPAELGLSETGGKVVLLSRSEQAKGEKFPLAKGDVVLITGGARGVTAEAAAALAASCGATLAVLGRSPLPAAEEAWLAPCRTEADIKKTLIVRTPGLAPKAAGEQCRNILAAREIRAQLNRFEAAGSRAAYYSADIRDAAAVKTALGRIVRDLGPVRGLVHGAGVLADKFILDKTDAQFDSVFDTKVGGLRNLLEALDASKLKAVALYSSSTARFGRAGQCDYAMANEVLNKTARLLARRLPDCRVSSLNWGPWDGGMVNDGLKALFAKEGVGVIGLEEGGKFLVNELSLENGPAEVVVVARPKAAAVAPASGGALSRAFDLPVSVADCPFLRSHVINGKAVVPTAVMTEWLAHAALHGNPGLLFHGFDNLKIYKGILLSGGTYKVSALAGKAAKKDGLFRVAAELRGPGGELHAGAEIVLAAALPKAGAPAPDFALKPYPRTAEKAYTEVLFHGEDMRFIRSVAGVSEQGIVLDAAASLPPGSWMRNAPRDRWLADPAALDAAFQGLILWTFENSGACSLPNSAASYRQFTAFPKNGVRISARVTRSAEHACAADIDFTDDKGNLVARLEGYDSTVDKALNAAFRKKELSAV
ncbi:MAG: SDR family NAD(P)-dependent oxidoreductase [Elusimicrobiales bacterium]|nr:SDR family NAD(P)-dependent oxidoreductase [Elusimicrobiales bacterium]